MRLQPFSNYYQPPSATSRASGMRSGNNAHEIFKLMAEGKITKAEFHLNGNLKSISNTPHTHPTTNTNSLSETNSVPTLPLTKTVNEEDDAIFTEANKAVTETLGKIKDCEHITPKKLETCWKTGLVLGGIGGGIIITALTLKLMLEQLKKEDPETYEKLKNYQWPVAIATDIYGLLFLRKAYQAWHRPLLKPPSSGQHDIFEHLAEGGLVIPQLLTMLKQCKLLLNETKDPEKRFSTEVYQLIQEKADWADRFLTFLVESREKDNANPRLNLKSSNYALVNLAKDDAIKQLKIKHLLSPQAKETLPWYEQLIGVFEAPINWTVGKLVGEDLVTVQEAYQLYNQAWMQKLATGVSATSDRYLSQINGEIEARASSDFERGLIPTEKQVQSMVNQTFPTRLLVTPESNQSLTSQSNPTTSNTNPLDNPQESPYTLPQKLNLFTAVIGSAFRAFWFPEAKK
ncbi:MAG: hypothetical protein NTW61_02490 [Candidatus Melainabacteria bacterium]|nr:hypothetical protein [Candidatus Melainabacteria bacterium]